MITPKNTDGKRFYNISGQGTSSGGTAWGTIAGNIDNQVDLKAALDAKQNIAVGAFEDTANKENVALDESSVRYPTVRLVKASVDAKQNLLVSGTTIKTVNSTSLLGSGDVAVQPTLVSGTNIKTVNGNSLLGSGNMAVIGVDVTTKGDLQTFSNVSTRLPAGTNGQILESRDTEATGLKWINVPTSVSVTTKGDLQTFSNAATRLPVGTDGQVLEARSSEATGLKWITNTGGGGTLVISEVPGGAIDSSNTAFTAAASMISNSLIVYQNGIRLKGGGVDFTQGSGVNFTFVTAPTTGDTILIDYQTSTGTFTTGSTSFVYNEVPTGLVNGSNTAYDTAHTYVAGTIQVYRDGQLMTGGGADYTETDNNTITFTTAPVTGSVILVTYQSAVSTAGNADTLDGSHLSEIIGLIYPVGSIYISTVSTNPGTLFGVGTWSAFGAGRTLVGFNASETEFDTVEETGGAKTVTLTVDQIPSHFHYMDQGSGTPGTGNFTQPQPNTNYANNSSTKTTGGGLSHNNLQPYIVTYMWKRTA